MCVLCICMHVYVYICVCVGACTHMCKYMHAMAYVCGSEDIIRESGNQAQVIRLGDRHC